MFIRQKNTEQIQPWQPSLETGRYAVPKTTENLRICPFCHLNQVEHELHFPFNSNLYNDNLRCNFYRDICNRYPLSNNFDNNEKGHEKAPSYLTTSILTAAYIHSCMDYRQKLVL